MTGRVAKARKDETRQKKGSEEPYYNVRSGEAAAGQTGAQQPFVPQGKAAPLQRRNNLYGD